MAFGTQVGTATLPIFPTMAGFRSKVSKEVSAAGRDGGNAFSKSFNGSKAGQEAGKRFKNGFSDSSKGIGEDTLRKFQQDVAKAKSGYTAAMLAQKSAANQVTVAENNLNAAIGKRDAATKAVASAQDTLSQAIATSGANSQEAQSATMALEAARQYEAKATTAAEAAQIRLEKAQLAASNAADKAAAASERLTTAQNALAQVSGATGNSVASNMHALMSSLANLGKTALSPITSLASNLGAKIGGAAKKLVSPITSKFGELKTKTGEAFTAIGAKASGALNGIGAKATAAFGKLPSGMQSALTATGGYLRNLGGAAGNVLSNIGSTARSAFGALGNTAKSAASVIGSHIRDGAARAKAALENMASVSMAGLTAGAVAVGAKLVSVGKEAFNLYATYEQAVGGIDTLFKGSSKTVQKYAAEAYRTAGVDANTYMQQITSFSASLISSLGGDTAQAAELGNLAMIDMSDNANKMGTSIESIQQTYQSLARGNYAMLDNLKLGYGGTKMEMERLIADANKLRAANGETADLSIEKFSDVVTAIHTVQTEMDITGTTAKEAATTIEGAIGMAIADTAKRERNIGAHIFCTAHNARRQLTQRQCSRVTFF